KWSGSAFAEELPGDANYRGASLSAIDAQAPTLTIDSAGHPFVAWTDIGSGRREGLVRGNKLNVGKVYYVKDVFQTGDSYTTAIGSAANSGLSPATPKASVQQVLDSYVLNPGDVILVDGGNYAGFTAAAGDNGFLVLGSPNHPNEFPGSATISGSTGAIIQRLNLDAGVSVTAGGNATFTANIIASGVVIDGGTGSQVVRNIIAPSSAGITIQNSAVNAAVAGNMIAGGSTGILVSAGTGLSIVANQVSGTSTGINFAGAAG